MAEFKDVAVLDIETTGLMESDKIGLVGVYGNGVMVQTSQADSHDMTIDCNTLITYNGTKFDLPFIKRALPNAKIQFKTHIDLMHVAMKYINNNGHDIDSKTHFISKDRSCQLMGIYVPRDPCGSGFRCAVISRKAVEGNATAQELSLLAVHNALDLYATFALFEAFVNEGWI